MFPLNSAAAPSSPSRISRRPSNSIPAMPKLTSGLASACARRIATPRRARHSPNRWNSTPTASGPNSNWKRLRRNETARALRAATGAGFGEVLAAQQIATRALGIWGLLLMAEALGLAFAPALLVAAICSLGALIPGPEVLTFEYEPTPRAFAVPLLVCAIGLSAHRRHLAAGAAAAAAFLYHPPTALPFWGVYFILALWPHAQRRARLAALIPLAAAVPLLWAAARAQSASGDAQRVFARLDSSQEFLQRMRTAYVWVSTWAAATIGHHLLILAVLVAAFMRIRPAVGVELRVLLLGLAALGLLTMPLSWLLLEQFHWGLVPQVQPMRALLFLTLA